MLGFNTNNLNSLFYRYDSTTGTFTVPSGGDGFYYFSTYLVGDSQEDPFFEIQINGETMCTALGDVSQSDNGDYSHMSCSAIGLVVEGMTRSKYYY